VNLSGVRSTACFVGASIALSLASCRNPAIVAAEKEGKPPVAASPLSPVSASSPAASSPQTTMPASIANKLPALGEGWVPLVKGDTLSIHKRATSGQVVFLARALLAAHPVALRKGPPSRKVSAQSQGCRVAVNAGYFSEDQSMSLLASGGVVITPGITELKRSDGTKHPVRGAMGFSPGKASARWAVAVSKQVHSFEVPQNASLSAHAGGVPWNVETIFGGGPVLITKGQVKASSHEELFDAQSGISPASRQPRTGVGFNETSGILFLVVSDGRQVGAAGHTLSEFAALFQELGASEAVNFDGGGSSAMTGDGRLLNEPSGGSERPVFSVLCVQ